MWTIGLFGTLDMKGGHYQAAFPAEPIKNRPIRSFILSNRNLGFIGRLGKTVSRKAILVCNGRLIKISSSPRFFYGRTYSGSSTGFRKGIALFLRKPFQWIVPNECPRQQIYLASSRHFLCPRLCLCHSPCKA